jgi:Family of unknown function (DUF6502)
MSIETLMKSLAVMLKPIVRLMLRGGVGYSEFSYVAKCVFVDVATQEYGLRSRPTNASRVSAITGISRKQVSQLRKEGPQPRWTPHMEANPLNTILHFWHHDPDFSSSRGRPRPLAADGPGSFAQLVARYGGDIPAGAIRATLIRAGSASEDRSGRLVARANYYFPTKLNDDFIRGVAFAFSNLGGTLVYNAHLREEHPLNAEEQISKGRLERTVWSEHLPEVEIPRFKNWVRDRAEVFIADANQWLGEHEMPKDAWTGHSPRSVGLGVYLFQED